MKLEIKTSELGKALQIVQGLTSTKSTLPILSNILLETTGKNLVLTTTDLEVAIAHTVIPEVVHEEGSLTIPGKKLYDAIREMPEGVINISVKKGNTATVQYNTINFKLVGLPKEEFPKIPTIKEKESIGLPQKMLLEMIEKTSFAVSKDETRYVLNGVLIEIKQNTLKLVATDGRRLAHIRREIKNTKKIAAKVIVPIKTIQEVSKLLSPDKEEEISIGIDKNHLIFQLQQTTIITRLIEGEFPNYEQVLPKEAKEKIEIDREDFIRGLKRANIFTTQDSQAIRLEVSKNKMVISKTTPELGQITEEVATTYTGPADLSIGFNPEYLLDVLKHLPDKIIKFEITAADKPGVIRLGEEYIYIVLPMQLV